MTVLQRTLLSLLLVSSAAIPASATTLYQGTLPDDSGVFLQPFTLSAAAEVTIQSFGYAGGTAFTSPLPTTIAAGGFAPDAILFDGTGSEIASDNGGHCGVTNTDPVTGNCDDPYIQQTLGPGDYTLALAVWDNVPNDGLLADGFRQDGNPGFTCAEFGASGNFCDVTSATGAVRTGNYAITISTQNIGAASVPEAPTFLMLMIACASIVMLARRNRQSIA